MVLALFRPCCGRVLSYKADCTWSVTNEAGVAECHLPVSLSTPPERNSWKLRKSRPMQIRQAQIGSWKTHRVPRGGRRDGVAMSNEQTDADKLLTPAEVAAMFRVNAKTVTRWARSGRLSAIKTMGGHRRYRLSEVRRAVEAINTDA